MFGMKKQQERQECNVTQFNPKLHCRDFVRMSQMLYSADLESQHSKVVAVIWRWGTRGEAGIDGSGAGQQTNKPNTLAKKV